MLPRGIRIFIIYFFNHIQDVYSIREYEQHVSVCASVSACHCALTCFADPLQVSVELSLNLLLSPQLKELAPVLHSLSLFGKFTVGTFVIFISLYFSSFQIERSTQYKLYKKYRSIWYYIYKKRKDVLIMIGSGPEDTQKTIP